MFFFLELVGSLWVARKEVGFNTVLMSVGWEQTGPEEGRRG